MIKIDRTPAPPILVPPPNPRQKAYASPEVRQLLIDMQHGKCCYCEKIVDLKSIFPDDNNLLSASNVEKHIEHFRPKGKDKYRHLTNEWSNLLLACNTCNANKGQKFEEDQDGNPLCIDPSDPNVDPKDHIKLNKVKLKARPDAKDGRIRPRKKSPYGKWTIINIQLNESTSRKDRWKKVSEVVMEIVDYRVGINSAEQRGLKLAHLRTKCAAKEEFAFAVREVCRQFKVPIGA